MKKQRYEISHDIIAEKIWNRLPKRDQVLREIQRSVAQRLLDFQEGRGSLLGKTELEVLKPHIGYLELTEAQKEYFEESTRAESDRQEREKGQINFIKYFGRTVVVVLGLIIFFTIILALSFSFSGQKPALSLVLIVNAFFVLSVFFLVYTLMTIVEFERSNNTIVIGNWFKQDYVVHKR